MMSFQRDSAVPMGRARFADGVSAARTRWREAGEARPSGYVLLLATVVVLNLVGLVMVLSASSVEAQDRYGSSWLFFQKHVVWSLLGVLALVVMSRLDYRLLRAATPALLMASSLLLVAVVVPGVGVSVSGASRWIPLGPLRVQPSEFAKLALLLYAAQVLASRVDRLHDWRATLRPVLAVLAVFSSLVMLQPDLGTTIVLVMIAGTILFVGGVHLGQLAVVAGGSGGLGLLLGLAEPYRRARLTSFTNPWADPRGDGYQVVQSLIALGSGGWTGAGLGASKAKWLFLPNAHTDFIFAVIGEELGMIGCLLVLAMILAFLVLGVRTSLRAPDRFGMLLAAGITGWVVGQSVVNIGAVIGLLPVTGVPLPFVSFGGSSLLVTMAATGVLLNVARQGSGE